MSRKTLSGIAPRKKTTKSNIAGYNPGQWETVLWIPFQTSLLTPARMLVHHVGKGRTSGQDRYFTRS